MCFLLSKNCLHKTEASCADTMGAAQRRRQVIQMRVPAPTGELRRQFGLGRRLQPGPPTARKQKDRGCTWLDTSHRWVAVLSGIRRDKKKNKKEGGSLGRVRPTHWLFALFSLWLLDARVHRLDPTDDLLAPDSKQTDGAGSHRLSFHHSTK